MLATRFALSRTSSKHLGSFRGLASSLLARNRPTESWTLAELKQEAKERGLAVGGTKAALLARLQSDESTRKGLSTTAANAASAPSTSTPPNVVSPASTPVNSPAKAPFKSTRTVRSAVVPGMPETADDTRFQPRRSAPLDIKMPTYEEAEQEGPFVPALPDNYGSSTNSPIPAAGEQSEPKVLKVSGLDEHLAAPSHPSANVTVNPPVEVSPPSGPPSSSPSSAASTTAAWSEAASGYAKTVADWIGTSGTDSSTSSDPKANFSSDEKRGLYVLGGIVFGGWLLGGVAKKDGLKEEH